MGHALAELLDDVGRGGVTRPAYRPQLSHDAAPDAKLSVREQLLREQCRPDVTIREGVRAALGELRSLERRLARIEGDAPDETTLLHAPSTRTPVLVSVLVPAFNARRLLPEALQSVERTAAEPGAPALEVIVVDDGSPQDDGAAAVEWAGAHAELPVTVLRHRYNRGLAAARNTALERARGELVLPLDADNALLPGGLERLLGAMAAEPDAVFAYGLLQEHDALDPVGLRGLYPWDPARLRYGNYIDALALIRRAALQELGGYAVDMPEQGYEDWDLWCRFADSGAAGTWVPQIVAAYRIRPDSMSAALALSHVAPLADMLERHPRLLG